VTLIDECPMRVCICFGLWPCSIQRVAQAWRRACNPYLGTSLRTGSPALLMMDLPASSKIGVSPVMPAAR
jgi:hypothetical protein